MNIVEALNTPDLFGEAFTGESWETWKAVYSAAFAIPMDDDRLERFKQVAGDRTPPTQRVRELWAIAGRRSAKSHTAASVAVYVATIGAELEGLTDKLASGERGVIALLATDRSQAKVLLQYINGIFDDSPVLGRMVAKRQAESIELTNRVTIEVSTSSYRAIRGRTLLAVIFDEIAFFRDSETSVANDKEIYRAAVPGLATTGGLLIGISSPYAKRGLLHDKYRKHFNQDGDILVVKGPTTAFNPTLPQSVIDDAMADDPEAAKTEWLGEFREGISSFIDRAVIDSCTRSRPLVLPYDKTVPRYYAFTDPAGGGEGANADQFTLAIGYKHDDLVVVAGVWGRKGSPAEIVKEYAEILKDYKVREVWSDRYAGSWPRDEFRKHGITLRHTDRNRSQLYSETLPMLNTGRLELPPDPVLANQFVSLERKTGRAGDIIDHPPGAGAHDDLSNAAAGLAVHAQHNRGGWHQPIAVTFAGGGGQTRFKDPATPYGH